MGAAFRAFIRSNMTRLRIRRIQEKTIRRILRLILRPFLHFLRGGEAEDVDAGFQNVFG
jgi:hypothetical protein